jgi:glycosyltransferase involved in cell wall biosynthesis
MDTTPLISIIVPIYNVERYVGQCLASLTAQTVQDIEVICVDDGSTDSSGDIADAWAAHDERLHVIHKDNGGYGSAVNRGLDEALGLYVGIVEPDDYIDRTMYEKLLAAAAENDNPDIVKAAFWDIVNPDTSQQRFEPAPYLHRIATVGAPFALADDAEFLFHHPSIWSAIYLRAFIDGCNIRMREIPGAGWADNPWLMETLVQACCIVYVDECLYYYRDFSAGKARVVGDPTILADRWIEMDDILSGYGVTAPRIIEGHYNRGCWHIKALLEGFDPQDPTVKECIRRIVDRIDYSFVCDSERINDGLKGALHSQVGALARARKRARSLLGLHYQID